MNTSIKTPKCKRSAPTAKPSDAIYLERETTSPADSQEDDGMMSDLKKCKRSTPIAKSLDAVYLEEGTTSLTDAQEDAGVMSGLKKPLSSVEEAELTNDLQTWFQIPVCPIPSSTLKFAIDQALTELVYLDHHEINMFFQEVNTIMNNRFNKARESRKFRDLPHGKVILLYGY